MFYYLLSNLPRKYRSVVDAINLYAVVRSEDVSTYGFDVILQPLLDDLKKLGIPTGNLIRLTDGSTIPVRASLVAYAADNPAVHQAIGLKESVGGSFRKCRLRDTDLHGSGSLNQDAAKSYLLFRIFPFVVGNGVDQTDRHWELYTLVSDITEISFSAVVSLDTVARLQDIVKEYLELFKQLFPDQPFTPKQHYLVHFPKVILLLGPLINLWAMRFEAKHQYFKGLKKLMNFKNICLSSSRHHQKAAAMNRSRNSIFKENENGPKERVSSALAVDIRTINSVLSFKWIKLHGTK